MKISNTKHIKPGYVLIQQETVEKVTERIAAVQIFYAEIVLIELNDAHAGRQKVGFRAGVVKEDSIVAAFCILEQCDFHLRVLAGKWG